MEFFLVGLLILLTALIGIVVTIDSRKRLSPVAHQHRARVAVLLTSNCTKKKYEHIYRSRFEWWSKNFYHVFVVDSCGEMVIPEFHERNVCSFTQDACAGQYASSTVLEYDSIRRAFKQFDNFVGFDLVFKITAKYVFPDINKIITCIAKHTNVVVQNRRRTFTGWQNSEIFALRPSLLYEFISSNKKSFMEKSLFQYTKTRRGKIRLPRIAIEKSWQVARGDGSILKYL